MATGRVYVRDLADVVRVAAAMAASVPEHLADLRDVIRLDEVDGRADLEAARLVLPGLPLRYVDVASRYRLLGVAILDLQLAPDATGARSLGAALVKAHERRGDRLAPVDPQLIEVGADGGGNPICVGSMESDQPDEVVLVSHEDRRTCWPLAEDFERFLVYASTIVAVHVLYESERLDDPVGEVDRSIRAIGAAPGYAETWRNLARASFS